MREGDPFVTSQWPTIRPESVFWRNENGYHHSENQHLASGICLQRVTYSGPGSTNEHRPGSRPTYAFLPRNCDCDDDWAGGHRNELALLLLQSHRFERLKPCPGLR